jgi:1A family penicillin-binding protein
MTSNPPPKRRSYGYIQSDTDRKPPADGETEPKKAQNKKTPNLLVTILLLPFKIIWSVLKILFWPFKKIFGFWEKRPKLPKQTKRNIRKKIFGFFVTVFILGMLGATIAVAWISKDLPDPDKLTDRQIAQSTKIYDRTGEHLLYEIFSEEKRTMVDMDEIPEQLINAVIATEDTAFYEHKGIRPLSIIRSIVYGVLGKSRLGSGASTLTQQLVKNAILTTERTYTRKIKEIILSVRLEQKYSKEQILKIYFNEIPYGSTNYGIESAAQSYFKKSVSELNLEEIAVLAGFPKAPSRYLTDKTALENRRDFVLERMFEEGYITREEADEAQSKETEIAHDFGSIKAPHFVLYVKEKLVEEFGEQFVDTGGLKVLTTLDWEKQEIAEKVIEEQSEKYFEEAEVNNTSLVSVDPKTGHVLAMVGSRDFFDEEINGQFNVATLGKRQPGSSFKPIVYTAAFEKGYTPGTVLFDVETNFAVRGDDYEPKNYDLEEHGLVTMRRALQGSLNIPAVKTLYLVGAEKGVDFAERLGYSTLSEGDFGLSLVLGGGEVKLLEHVSAYGIFANEGVYHKPISILKVEDSNGDVLKEWKKSKGERVLDEKITATISDVLSDDNARSFAFGSGGVLTLADRPVAAKTGTTNGYVDAWTLGYTPSLVTGVWAGNTDNTPMKQGYGGSKVAAPIWNNFMSEALKDTEVEHFPEPPPNDAEKPVLRGSQGTGITLLVDKVTGKLATSSTPQKYTVERTYIPPHSILHYVKKDDPRGPAPEDPIKEDEQYEVWETAIQDWITRSKEENPDWEVAFDEPPTEFDDVHSLELIPSLKVVYPIASSTLVSRQIDTDIRVSAPRGISKVTYKIDEKFIAVIKEHPFNLNYYATGLENGDHSLFIIAEDDIGNQVYEEINFTLEAGIEAPSVTWVERNKSFSQNDFPRVFFLRYFKLDQIKEVNIYKQKIDSNKKIMIGKITDLTNTFNNQLLFNWNEKPEKGEWELIAVPTLKNNGRGTEDKTTINIQ